MYFVMKFDFLIYYEHAARELESDCYLASILKKRGYKVKVINRHHLMRVFYSPKVIIVPFLYGDKDVHEFTGYLSGRRRAIVNLQYEQLLNDVGLKAAFYHPSGAARSAIYICWGNNSKSRLLKDGIDAVRLPVTGAIGMDFNREELRSFLKSKNDLAEEYHLKPGKQWHLFISSFSLCSLSETDLGIIEQKIPGYSEFVDVAKSSQSIIVLWLKQMALKYPDKEFIYRPHPNEHNSDVLTDLANSASNIHIIGDYSIRQWVNICETSSSWFSTSTVDCFFANKPCCILRPVIIPSKFDQKIFDGCRPISTPDEFDVFLADPNAQITPLNKEVLSDYYLTTKDKLYGELTADVCEEAFNNDCLPYSRHWKDCLRSFKYDVLASIFLLLPFLGSNKKSRFHGFHMRVQETKYDKILIKEYMNRFNEFFSDGR